MVRVCDVEIFGAVGVYEADIAGHLNIPFEASGKTPLARPNNSCAVDAKAPYPSLWTISLYAYAFLSVVCAEHPGAARACRQSKNSRPTRTAACRRVRRLVAPEHTNMIARRSRRKQAVLIACSTKLTGHISLPDGLRSSLVAPIIHKGALAEWIVAMRARKPERVVAVALANKLARIAWAMMSTGEAFRTELYTKA
jgi:hypothetical protein